MISFGGQSDYLHGGNIKTRALKLVATAKRYCLEILAINDFFYYGGQKFSIGLIQRKRKGNILDCQVQIMVSKSFS